MRACILFIAMISLVIMLFTSFYRILNADHTREDGVKRPFAVHVNLKELLDPRYYLCCDILSCPINDVLPQGVVIHSFWKYFAYSRLTGSLRVHFWLPHELNQLSTRITEKVQ